MIQFSNSHDMLSQQKQEMAPSVPDPFPVRGGIWGQDYTMS